MKHYIVAILAIIWICYYFVDSFQEKVWFEDEYMTAKYELLNQKNISSISNTDKKNITDKPESQIENKPIQTKDSVDLSVDFYPQSPFWKWGPIFEDTCEEASLLLALNYIRWDYMNRIQFRDELLKIVDWQNKNFWYFKDTSVEQTAEILKRMYNFQNLEIINNPEISDIKQAISDGNIVIAPLYAIWLNPNYGWSWPDYHFVVIKWYTKNSFITHDVGTKKWENYVYNQNTLYNRIHDYHSTDIELGDKKIIILKKDNK